MASQQPNILFITSDQHRWDALGAYGRTPCRTPNLDALAAHYWPVRSFRASEEVAAAYYHLYKAMGGKRNEE